MSGAKRRGDRTCPKCQDVAIVDTWTPPKGLDPKMRKFLCTNCGHEFYQVIYNPKLLQYYDRQLSRR